jgi:hypothetical protein
MDKQHIIDEIRRTAAQNGGAPLGARRFELETGIRKADWWAKYWTRWGDALKEAGFTPNELQGAFEDTHLLDKLAELALTLKKIPTVAEVRLARARDPTSPTRKCLHDSAPKQT